MAASPWSGSGWFAAADPATDAGELSGLGWYACIPEQTTPEQAATIRALPAPPRLTLWSPYWASKDPGYIMGRLHELGAVGWCGEVETPANNAPAEVLHCGVYLARRGVPVALTGPNFSLVWGRVLQRIPRGWTLLPYAYTNVDPADTPARAVSDTRWHMWPRSKQAVVPLLGCFQPSAPLSPGLTPTAEREQALQVYAAQLPALRKAGKIQGAGAFIWTSASGDERRFVRSAWA